MKKLLAILMALAMVLTMATFPAFAEGTQILPITITSNFTAGSGYNVKGAMDDSEDGNTNYFRASVKITSSGSKGAVPNTANLHFVADLGLSYSLTSVYTSFGKQYAEGVVLWGSNDGTTWEEIADLTLTAQKSNTAINNDKCYRYVMLEAYKTKDNDPAILEVTLYGNQNPDMVKITGLTADNVTVTGGNAGTLYSSGDKGAIFNGDTSNSASINSFVMAWTKNPVTIEVALEETVNISNLLFYWGNTDNSKGNYWNQRPAKIYDIYFAGEDGEYGESAYRHEDTTITSTPHGTNRNDIVTFNNPVENVSKIKVVVSDFYAEGCLALRELEIYKFVGEITKSPASYTVKYVDEDGNEILDAKVVEDKLAGDSVTEAAPDIAGYKPTETSKTVILTTGDNTITFTYIKAEEANYVVKYLDESGNAVAEDKKVSGYEGDVITEAPLNLFGDSYFTTDVNKSITLEAGDDNEIVFTYKKVIKVKKFTGTQLTAPNWWNKTLITDGKINTSSTLNDTGAESPVAEMVFEFDKVYAFDTMNIYTNTVNVNVTVYVSDDGETWGDPIIEATYPGEKFPDRKIYSHEIDLGGAEGMYIKYEVNGNTYPTFHEVIFEGKEPSHLAPIGASIRLPEQGLSSGLRFASKIIKEKVGIEGDYHYSEGDTVKFGTALIPETKLQGYDSLAAYINDGGENVLYIPAKKVYAQDDKTVTFTAVLTDIPEEAYGLGIVAVPYMVKDGTYIFYEEVTRSYRSVAKAARTETYTDEAIAAITDSTLKAQWQAIADQLDEIIESVVETKTVTPAESAVYSMGRTYSYSDLYYSGAVYEYKCTGSVVGAKVSRTYGDDVKFEVSIDGGEFVSYTISDTTATEIIFATDLNPAKEHVVRIMRISDIWAPKMTVNSVVVSEDGDVVDNYTRDYDLKIEFVGDSITSGVKTNSYSQSYAYLTAEAFNANFNIVSRSGLGLHKNASNNTSNGQLPDIYASIVAGDGGYTYDYDPDLVVLNIGTNDGANVRNLATDEEKAEYRTAFTEKYVQMLEVIHEKNPNATILCTGGLMGDFGNVKAQVTEAVELFKSENPDAKVYCQYLSTATDCSADTSWHPGVSGHKKGAEELIPIIKSIMNIK